MVLITDSSASIDIVAELKTGIGMKIFLQPEAEAGMEEVWSLMNAQDNVTYKAIKVWSYIEREDAPNERYWKIKP